MSQRTPIYYKLLRRAYKNPEEFIVKPIAGDNAGYLLYHRRSLNIPILGRIVWMTISDNPVPVYCTDTLYKLVYNFGVKVARCSSTGIAPAINK